jgi:glycosyltransferase involved in cell wall biosynthesis
MNASPRVTVLIPVFNRERFVDEAIRSVLEQDFQDFELLLVDDGSTDGTPAVLRAWQQRDPRIFVVTSPQNLGIPGALNLGLRHARAPHVARLDSDDLMMPQRLAAQAAVLDEHPEVVLVSSMYEIVDAEGNHVATWRGEEPHEVVVHLLGFYNIVGGHSQVMYRLSDVMNEGGYSLDHPASEDYDLWVRLLRRGRILTLPIVGMKQRDHDARSNVRYGSTKRANWTSIMRRSLEATLDRTVTDDEIDALITLWRHDGVTGHGALADRTMREAFAKFCARHSDHGLRGSLRERTARQWLEAAGRFASAGHRAEAVRYVLRAMRWSAPAVFAAARARLTR